MRRSPSQKAGQRAVWWTLPVGLVIFLLARHMLLQGRPERLLVLPYRAQNLAIRSGQLYWTTRQGEGAFVGGGRRGSNRFTIQAQPLSGGETREIAREELKGSALYNVAFTARDAYFIHSATVHGGYNRSGYTMQSYSAGRDGRPARVLGEFLRPLEAVLPRGRPGESVSVMAQNTSYPGVRSLLRRVPLSGGTAQTIPLDTGGIAMENVKMALTDSAIFWSPPRADEVYTVRNPKGLRVERRAACDLVITPRAGGPSRRIPRALLSTSLLFPAPEGVYWRMPRPYPDPGYDLWYQGATEPAPRKIPDANCLSAPLHVQGRCYWIDPTWNQSRIMSMNPDGSDRRPVLTFPSEASQRIQLHSLLAHEDRLYLVYSTERMLPLPYSPGDFYLDALEYTLAALHPDRPEPLGRRTRLPQRIITLEAVPSDGYLYFTRPERRGNWLRALLSERLPTVRVLYRVPLPRP